MSDKREAEQGQGEEPPKQDATSESKSAESKSAEPKSGKSKSGKSKAGKSKAKAGKSKADESTVARHESLWRAHELLGAVAIALWVGFHIWEQWAAFRGVDAFVARMVSTSHGGLSIMLELCVGIAPALAWVGLDFYLARRAIEPRDLALAMAESEALALRLGRLTRWGSRVFFVWMIYHAAWLWLPKMLGDADPLSTWLRLRGGAGSWLHAGLHAVGLTAFGLHFWAAGPRLAAALGWASSSQTRRATRLSAAIVTLGLLPLLIELYGWHAAGAGTLWSIP